jgi:outer membrane protein TolC
MTYLYQRLRKAAAGNADRDQKLYHIGFGASWELDFFGRVRRAMEAGTADASHRDVIASDTHNSL